jgi:hypothetical protein
MVPEAATVPPAIGGRWQVRETEAPPVAISSPVAAEGEVGSAIGMPPGAREGDRPQAAINPVPADVGRAELRHVAARVHRVPAPTDPARAFTAAPGIPTRDSGAATSPLAPALPVAGAIGVEGPAANRSSVADLAAPPYAVASLEARHQLPTPAPRVEASAQAARPADEAELPDQIVQSLRLQITSGGGEARVHLRPEYLGALTVRVLVEDGVVSARLEAERPAVREWIERHEVSLRQALGEHGLTLDALNVSDHGSDDTLDRGDGEPTSDSHTPDRQRRPRRRRDGHAPRFEVTA